jgi:hypothetical protein
MLAVAIALGGIARRHVVLSLVVLTALLPVLLNLVLLSRYSAEIAPLFALGTAALIVGGVLSSVWRSGHKEPNGPTDVRWGAFATTLALVAVAGTMVHFAVGGIPLLSSNVEIARFNVTASGFLGIPGRIYLFGLPLALAACLRAERLSDKGAFSSWQTRLVLITFVISRLLSGFKGGLVEVVLTTLIVYFASGHSMRRKYIPRLLAALVVALAFGVAVGVTYSTYQGRGVVVALIDRIGFQTSDPAAVVIAHAHSHDLGANSVAIDATYFTSKYFHIGDSPSFSFSQIVSARVTGTPLSQGGYFVPVTTTAIAEQIYDFGVPLACLTLALTGYVIQSAEHGARRTVKPYLFLATMTVVLAGFEYVSKGGLIYAIYNWSAVCLLLIAIAASVRILLLVRPRNKDSRSRRLDNSDAI